MMVQTASWKRPFHQARRALAKSWLHLHPGVEVIGVTGSYGKTNTTRAIATVLSEKYRTLQTDINLDTVYNLPITILKLRPWHQKLVLEYGVDHKYEMDFHLSLVKPAIVVVTGINPTHSEPELFGSLQGVIAEKSKLLAALREDSLAFLNWDDSEVRKMARATKAEVIRYGLTTEADLWADQIKVTATGTLFTLHYEGKKLRLKTGLVGHHFVQNCLSAAAVGFYQGVSWSQIKRGLARLTPLSGRVSIEKGPRGSVLINDSLRANPASTKAGLQVLAELPTRGRRIAVLGEMGELGSLSEKSHREVGQFLGRLGKIDFLVSVGPMQKLVAQEAVASGMKKEKVFWVADVDTAAAVLKKILRSGDLFYLKASLLRHLERVLYLLAGQRVGCQRVSCHFYQLCNTCPNLHKDSPNV